VNGLAVLLVQNKAVLCWRNGKNTFSASVIWYKARSLAVLLVQNEAVLCWRNGKNTFSASVIWYKARSLAMLTGIRKGFRSGSRVNVLLLE
jgi:hypothetical protein